LIAHLIEAEARAQQLLDACVIVPGVTEGELSDQIWRLAGELFGVRRFWHKRVVRSGRNTLLPYRANPPELTIQADDIVYLDFGPVFADWEADVGRTIVVGDDPLKHRLAADVARAWDDGAAFFRAHPDVTAAQLYGHVGELARRGGWEFGNVHCGHLLGRFPHETTELDNDTVHLRADNPLPLRRLGQVGEPLRWILEIHFVDRAAGIGGFQEALLLEPAELERSRA
jgi:Xaa-Pro dipeptidase